ncbi:MAG: signal peptidase I [bacterium]|nr:signal peptidase I [bacterium]
MVSLAVFAVLLSPETKLFSPEIERGIVQKQGCVSSVEEKIVRGNSLTGVIEPGETVKILFGYYDCNEIKKEDIIVYSYAGNPVPLIKIVKGIPGDSFRLQKEESGPVRGKTSNGVNRNILIKGEVLKNAQSQPYLIGESGYRMLSLYERDYKGVIPENAYLLLGNLASGSLDGTHFGLIGKADILGKVEY